MANSCPVRNRVIVAFLFLRIALLPTPVAYAAPPARTDSYQIVHVYPHDPNAFTQGLVYLNGKLYESTGLNGRSSLRTVDISSGRILQRYDLPMKYFGEALTDWGSNWIQLTWQTATAFF